MPLRCAARPAVRCAPSRLKRHPRRRPATPVHSHLGQHLFRLHQRKLLQRGKPRQFAARAFVIRLPRKLEQNTYPNKQKGTSLGAKFL